MVAYSARSRSGRWHKARQSTPMHYPGGLCVVCVLSFNTRGRERCLPSECDGEQNCGYDEIEGGAIPYFSKYLAPSVIATKKQKRDSVEQICYCISVNVIDTQHSLQELM